MRNSFVLILAIVLLISALGAQPVLDREFSKQLQETLDKAFKASPGVGVSAALIMPDGKMWQGVAGISAQGVPVTCDMLFDIGSAQKNLQAALTLKLVETGLLSLNDTLAKWLPTYPNMDPMITIRQLLNQTDGIDGFVADPTSPWRVGYGNIDFTKKWTPEEIFTTFVGKPLFAPGKGWAYSQTNYILLRMIIEKASGMKIHAALDKWLLKPMGMAHTIADLLDPLPPGLTIAHGWLDEFNNGHRVDISGNSLNWLATFAPMLTYSTPADMVTWIHALLHEKRVLSKPMLDKMLSFQATSPEEPLLKGYGLGLMDFNIGLINPKLAKVAAWGHSGTQYGFSSATLYFPEFGFTLSLLINRGCDNETNAAVGIVLNALLDLVTGRVTPQSVTPLKPNVVAPGAPDSQSY